MAYILGFFCADGNLVETKRGTHFIAWYSADEQLLQQIRKALDSEHVISGRSAKAGQVFRLQIGSREWFDDLQKLGLETRKASRMKLPLIPKKYKGDFVRGYFDGDGNVWTGTIHKNRAVQHQTMQVAFTSASHEFLSSLYMLLQKEGVVGGSVYQSRGKNFSRLSYAKYDALTIYKIMYNSRHKLFLDRKKRVFERFMKDNNCGGSSTG